MAAPPLPHYEVHGRSGPHLLLVHGLLSSRAQWQPNLDELSKRVRPVVLELYGHGRSPSPARGTHYEPDAYVAAFERVREELDAERWFVCGQSLGAALTLRYALAHPDRVIAQVFTNSNSALAPAEQMRAAAPAMETFARRVSERGHAALDDMPVHPRRARNLPDEVREALVADCALHDARGVALTSLHTVVGSSVRDRIAHTRVPTLLVRGGREKRFADHAAHAAASFPALESCVLDAGHAVNIEAAREFDAAVLRFLAGKRSRKPFVQ